MKVVRPHDAQEDVHSIYVLNNVLGVPGVFGLVAVTAEMNSHMGFEGLATHMGFEGLTATAFCC